MGLMADDLTRVPYAIRLGRMARRTVRFNIAAALVLRAVLAVGAVLGVVNLAVAVLVGPFHWTYRNAKHRIRTSGG